MAPEVGELPRDGRCDLIRLISLGNAATVDCLDQLAPNQKALSTSFVCSRAAIGIAVGMFL